MKLNPKYKEIFRLEKMLQESHIPYESRRFLDGYQIIYPSIKEWKFDIIQHYGSYGGGIDRLEVMGKFALEDNGIETVKGFLTAEEAFDELKKYKGLILSF